MLRWLVLFGLILPVPALGQDAATTLAEPEVASQEIAGLPSGQVISLIEALANIPGPNGLAMRYRFLAPAIARDIGTIDADLAGADMDWLCTNYALPRLPSLGPKPSEVIISMSDRNVPFGEEHPEATQFFNAYDIADGTCQWEMF